MKSWGCTALAFLPNSLRKFGERAVFFPPLVKGGSGGVGRVTVECTTEHKLGAIDEFDCACAGSPLSYGVSFPNVVAGERRIH